VLDGGPGDNLLIQDGGDALATTDLHSADLALHAPTLA